MGKIIGGASINSSANGIFIYSTASRWDDSLALYAGDNITLSQQSQSITIIGASGGGTGGGGPAIQGSGTYAQNSGTIQFANSHGLTFGLTANQMTASHNGLTSQSGQALSGSNGSLAFQTATFGNSNGLIFYTTNGSMVGSYTVPSVPTAYVVSLNGSSAQLSISGGNNITVGNNLSTITISGPNTHAQQTGISGIANSQTTFISGTVSLSALTNITIDSSVNGVSQFYRFSCPNIPAAQTGISGISNSQTMFTSGSLILSEQANITIGSSVNGASQWFRFSVAAPGGGGGINGIAGSLATTYTSGTVYFSAQANITINTSVDGVSQYLRLSAPAPSGGGVTYPMFENVPGIFTSLNTIGQGSLSLMAFDCPYNVTATRVRIGGSRSCVTNTSATTASCNLSLNMGIYTLNGSTLSLASSGSANNGFQWSQTGSSTANSSVNSMRELTVPMNINMTPGRYWMAAVISSATTYTSLAFTIYGNSAIASAASNALMAPNGNTSVGRPAFPWQGIYTAATISCPNAIQTDGINFSSASNVQRANFYFQLLNATY